MTSDFILPYRRLNLNSLTLKKSENITQTTRLLEMEAVEIFEYRKNNDGY